MTGLRGGEQIAVAALRLGDGSLRRGSPAATCSSCRRCARAMTPAALAPPPAPARAAAPGSSPSRSACTTSTSPVRPVATSSSQRGSAADELVETAQNRHDELMRAAQAATTPSPSVTMLSTATSQRDEMLSTATTQREGEILAVLARAPRVLRGDRCSSSGRRGPPASPPPWSRPTSTASSCCVRPASRSCSTCRWTACRPPPRGSPIGRRPNLYLAAARALDVDREEIAVFDDTAAGVEAGRAGHFGYVVGVERPGRGQDRRLHGADTVVGDLGALLSPKAA